MDAKDIKTVKLVSGEEVIGSIREEGDYLVVIKPHVIRQTQEGMALTPWLMFAEEEDTKISLTSVMCTATTVEKIAKVYIEKMTGQPQLAVPNKPSLVLPQ